MVSTWAPIAKAFPVESYMFPRLGLIIWFIACWLYALSFKELPWTNCKNPILISKAIKIITVIINDSLSFLYELDFWIQMMFSFLLYLFFYYLSYIRLFSSKFIIQFYIKKGQKSIKTWKIHTFIIKYYRDIWGRFLLDILSILGHIYARKGKEKQEWQLEI